MRYNRLWPPPLWKDVVLPWLLRPPDLVKPCVRALNGPPFHNDLLSVMTRPRMPAAAEHAVWYQAYKQTDD